MYLSTPIQLLYILSLQVVLCKLMGSVQVTCLYFSTFSILLVAIDRYRFILHSRQLQISAHMVFSPIYKRRHFFLFLQAVLLSMLAFMLSVLLSSPLFIISKLKTFTLPLIEINISICHMVRANWWFMNYLFLFLL